MVPAGHSKDHNKDNVDVEEEIVAGSTEIRDGKAKDDPREYSGNGTPDDVFGLIVTNKTFGTVKQSQPSITGRVDNSVDEHHS
jgi:hypothetical protein